MVDIATVIGVILSAAALVVAIVVYWLSTRVRAPFAQCCYMFPELGYMIYGLDLDDMKEKQCYGFPTSDNPIFRPLDNERSQRPVLEFELCNPGPYEVQIRQVTVRVSRYRISRFYVGFGELCAGAGDATTFTCELAPKAGTFLAKPLIEQNTIRIPPHANWRACILVACPTEGIYDIHPAVEWTSLWKRQWLSIESGNYSVVFFRDAPPNSSRPILAH